MKIKQHIIILIAACLVSLSGYSQHKSVREALKAIQGADLETAKLLLDSAAIHQETQSVASTWYYRGFVYKDLYNQKEKTNPNSSYRLTAIDCFKKFFELDTAGELTATAQKTLKYLSSTIYNDAAGQLNPEKYSESIANYELYKQTVKITDPAFNFDEMDKEYYRVLAYVYTQVFESNRETNKQFFDKSVESYQKVLAIDPNDCSGNYNLGILYYNEAVNIIKSLDYDLDLITLELIQNECVELFKQSLPFMLKAYEACPKRKEVLIGLSGIYFSLNELEKSQQIQKELELLEEGGSSGSKSNTAPTETVPVRGNDYSFVLSGRNIASAPKMEQFSKEEGKVVLDIVVDKSGKVKSAKLAESGSTTKSGDLIKKAQELALGSQFNPSETASEEQKGQMTFTFFLE